MWRDKKTPRKWKKGLIVKLPKKGNLNECKNWRGIMLLSVVSKVMGRIDHFTVVGLVTLPLNDSEARGDLVLIQTSLLLLCKSSCSYAN